MADKEETLSSVFAAEIEVAAVSMLWHHTEWLAEFMRELDPGIHLFQAHLRRIIEAIGISAAECNCADWPSVVQVVRELGCYEELGGAEGLNAVYSAVEPTKFDYPVLCHYIDMLKRYAIARDRCVPIYRFIRGDFVLEPNKLGHSESAPDFIGSGRFSGRECRVLGYQQSQQIRLAILPQ